MMRGISRGLRALALVIAIPNAALAQPHPAGPSRPAAPPARPAPPPPRPAPPPPRLAPPPSRPAPPNPGGFNFNRDVNPRPVPVQRPVTPGRTFTPPQPTGPQRTGPLPVGPQRTGPQPVGPQRPTAPGRSPGGPRTPPTTAYPRAPFNGSGGPYQGRFHGPVVHNPRAPGGAWQWNHQVVWRPAQTYWGGGFWGPFALGALGSALLYGSIPDYQNQVMYPSYQVEADSPGAELLQNYGLQQTPCGPPNLVVIWGPDNSVICAFPNDSVGPGNYELDPSTLTIVSASP